MFAGANIVYVYDDSGELTSTYQAIVINTKADGRIVIYDCEENKNITLMNSMIVVDKYSDMQLTADLFYFVDLTYPEIKPKRIIQPVFDKGKNMISE